MRLFLSNNETDLNPEWLDGPGALLVDGEAVREVDDLVLGAVDHQDGGGNFRDFVDAGKKKAGELKIVDSNEAT